ncbi:ABC-2 type transport system permease protein [Actinopolymorpha cephalotaxi]|uniref:Transport permease protein n=1 Tax=Actinopolymorpha cephalotaxi TaxID=504797 RepID=A0A1I2R374_9ACTN|nr:ABC transporter permease [Actinopolymorpha cephalotaxi]NYH82463.1 ABC-2 type transport system permease protein [Actinopolymorpha cephalotaxi]SFG32391.1 ABC-2 type transport system permease protein [Actinopolymorpha cephalotaxi]
MSAATFTPRPGAASLPRMVVAQGLMEARLLFRNGEQVVLALVIPLLLLAAGTLAPGLSLGPQRRIDVLAPGVIGLAVMSTAFTSLAIATAFERRYGVLKRLGVSPLPRTGLLAGKVLAVLMVEVVQVVLIGAVAYALGWRPSLGAGTVGAVVVLVVAGTSAFAALGLLMAGTLRAEATLAGANLVYLLLVVCGATLVPVTSYPAAIQPLIGWLPSAALAEGLRQVLGAAGATAVPSWGAVAGSVGILVAWLLAAALATSRTFRWE